MHFWGVPQSTAVHSLRRLIHLIFLRASSVCGLPGRPYLIASMTWAGLGLPRLLAAIFSRRPWTAHVFGLS